MNPGYKESREFPAEEWAFAKKSQQLSKEGYEGCEEKKVAANGTDENDDDGKEFALEMGKSFLGLDGDQLQARPYVG